MVSEAVSSSNPKVRFFLIEVFSTSFYHLTAFNPYWQPTSSSSQHPAHRSSRPRREAIVVLWPVLQLMGHLYFLVALRNFATSNYGSDEIPKYYMQTYKPRRFNIIPNHLSTPAQPNGILHRFNIMQKHRGTPNTPRSQISDLHLCHLVSNVHPTQSITLS